MNVSIKIPSAEMVAAFAGIAIPCLLFGRLVTAVLLIAAVLALLWLPGRRAYAQALAAQARTPLGVMVLAMLALWLPAVVLSPLPFRSFEAWVRVPVFIALVTLLWAMFEDRRQTLPLALKALVAASAGTVLFALIGILFLPEALAFVRIRGWTAISPDHFVKEYASVAILLVPVLLLAGRRLGGRWRTAAAVTAIGLLAVVWLSYNRSALAGLLAMLFVGGVLVVALRRNAVDMAALVVLLAAVTLAVALWLHGNRGDIQAPAGTVVVAPTWLIDYQRQTIWAHAIHIGMQAPWFGNGINVINLLPDAGARLPTTNLNVIPAHPHNWLVEVFAETGAVGAFALLTVVITLCLDLAAGYLRTRDPAYLAAVLVSVGYWGSGLFNVSVWSAWWQVCFLLLTAFCLAARDN